MNTNNLVNGRQQSRIKRRQFVSHTLACSSTRGGVILLFLSMMILSLRLSYYNAVLEFVPRPRSYRYNNELELPAAPTVDDQDSSVNNTKIIKKPPSTDTSTRSIEQATTSMILPSSFLWQYYEPKGVILSNMFTYAKDPQRPDQTIFADDFEYIHNFYVSVVYHKLRAVVFHDGLSFSKEFILRYEQLPYFQFYRIDIPTNTSLSSVNDYRFQVFYDYVSSTTRRHQDNTTSDTTSQQILQQYKSSASASLAPQWYIIADLKDVFFNSNPFLAMADYQHGNRRASTTTNRTNNSTVLFVGRDSGTWFKNRWSRRLFRICYGRCLPEARRHHILLNAGLWGGASSHTTCVLKCMARHLRKKTRSYNCNMVVHNYCVYFGGCFGGAGAGEDETSDYVVNNHKLFNPTFSRRCDRPNHAAIHDKCGPKLCLWQEEDSNGVTRLKTTKNQTNCVLSERPA
jgi:hypothetical protein